MNVLKNKIIKSIIAIVSAALLLIAAIFYIPKFFTAKKQTSTAQFSRPDARRDEIAGKVITLKRYQPEYAKAFMKMCTPVVRKPLYLDFPWTLENVKKQLQKEARIEKKGDTLWYLIFDNADEQLVGSVQIREYAPYRKSMPGQFTCWLNEKYWGGGRIREAIKLIAHEYFRLHKDAKHFDGHVEMDNLRSYYALKKAGFKLFKTWEDPEGFQKPRYILIYPNPAFA